MRTVFSNAMCAHVWAQQEQEYGRSKSMHFQGDTIYSYSTPIAKIVQDVNGNKIGLVTSHRYSMTTSSKHMPEVRHALHYESFDVPSLVPDHAENLTYLLSEYEKQKLRLRRMLSEPYSPIYDCLKYTSQAVQDYASAFGLQVTIDQSKDAEEIEKFRAERTARLNTPKAIEKRERERVRRQERREKAEAEKRRIAALTAAERIAAWRNGENVYLHWSDSPDTALLRIKGDVVQTSLRADAPLAHVLLALRVVKQCRDTQTEWTPNGHTLHVGHFTIDRISATGEVWAGCHYFSAEEVQAFEKLVEEKQVC